MNQDWDAEGWYGPARRAPSPYCDARPPHVGVDLVVIHAISLPPEQFGSGDVPRFFQGTLDFGVHPYYAEIRELRVSAHFFIERDGQLWQHVPIWARAWHAGVSSWQGRPACNDFSIGIELEGSASQTFTDLQYRSLNALLAAIGAVCPDWAPHAVTGHEDIAPGRKWDPGPHFDWQRLEGGHRHGV